MKSHVQAIFFSSIKIFDLENNNSIIIHAHVNQGERVPTGTAVVFHRQCGGELVAFEQLSILKYKPRQKKIQYIYALMGSYSLFNATRLASLV